MQSDDNGDSHFRIAGPHVQGHAKYSTLRIAYVDVFSIVNVNRYWVKVLGE